MALRPVVSVGNGVAVLSLDVDATDTVTGWQIDNTLPGPVLVRLARGPFSVAQEFPSGSTAGAIPANRRWAFFTADAVSYSLTARF